MKYLCWKQLCSFFSLLSILYIPFALYCKEENLTDRSKMEEIRVGNCGIVSWKEKKYEAQITKIEEDSLTMTIFDSSFPAGQWPQRRYSVEEVDISTYSRSPEINSLEELIASLKEIHILQSDVIEKAFRKIDRAWFCPEYPYANQSINIGCGMCISTPLMHVINLELLKEKFPKSTKILDLGSGSGYLTAVFAHCAPQARVIGIEYYDELRKMSQESINRNLPQEEKERIVLLTGDGSHGFLQEAPYDIINVGFMCKGIPQELIDQLRPGGRLLIPSTMENRVSWFDSCLRSGKFVVIDKRQDGSIEKHELFRCSYVPSQSDPEADHDVS